MKSSSQKAKRLILTGTASFNVTIDEKNGIFAERKGLIFQSKKARFFKDQINNYEGMDVTVLLNILYKSIFY